MKKIVNFYGIIIMLLISQGGNSQPADSLYKVSTWYGFRKTAVSFTFDDGSPNQYSKAIPLFNEFEVNLTLFIVTESSWAWPANWSVLQNAADKGHEIASHTVTHTSFAEIDDSLENIELEESQKEINNHITGQQCITMAYPFCVTGNKSICRQYYIAARICSGVIEPSTPPDFMAISSIICGSEGSVRTSGDFINRADSALQSRGWCIYLIHGVDNDGGWSSVSSEVLRETLQYMSEHPNDYWVDTFGNVARYIKERDAACIKELSVQDNSISIQVSDTLDDKIFNYPISIRRLLPEDWTSCKVAQNGQPVEAQIREEDDTRYIQFEVIPDKGEVVISRCTETVIPNHE